MSTYLQINHHQFHCDQLIAALIRYNLLESFIGHVILEDALQDLPLPLSEVCEILGGQNLSEAECEPFLSRWREARGMTLEYFMQVTMREFHIEKFKQFQFADDLEAEFSRDRSHFDQVEYFLIQVESLALAQELYFQIRDDGVTFEQLLDRHSQTPTNGKIGPVSAATLPPEIMEQLRQIEVGTVLEPIVVGDRVWLIRIDRFTPAQWTQTIRTQLLNRRFTRWLNAQVKELIAQPGAIAILNSP